MSITENYQKIRETIPEHVTIVVAAKQRTPNEITEVIKAGATDIGENYVQEGEKIYNTLSKEREKVRWHMIGHLQTNKINKALKIFDVIQTIDSLEMAQAIDKRVEHTDKKVIPVYIEINIGSEISKSGIKPDYKIIEKLAKSISELEHLRLEGLMTLGPIAGNPEQSRPYFREVRGFFEKIRGLNLPRIEMKTLSMGMTNSYKVAIEEGANMVRIGTAIFGVRGCKIFK
ncbi:MAG: YggS family pyridoxal phosphate-dependent enzyme [Candidatus Marinimicrobia bacterium]|nr:YggS family pyridoxal phosphate-dependent enzyme [Candidatus Neomarinimicrobiota bacterium]